MANHGVANFLVRGWPRQSDAGASLGGEIMQLILKHYVGDFGLKNLPAHHDHSHHHGYPEDTLPHRNLLADARLRSHREAKTVSRCSEQVYSPEATGGPGPRVDNPDTVPPTLSQGKPIVAPSFLSTPRGAPSTAPKTPTRLPTCRHA